MQTTLGSHPSEETLELYASNELPEQAVPSFEEHVLLCDHCQTRLDALENHLRIAAAAAKEIRESAAEKKSYKALWFGRQYEPVWVTAMGALLLFAVIPMYRASHFVEHSPPFKVALESTRGGAQTLIAGAPAGRVVLEIDASQLPAVPSYKVQLVNAQGREIWSDSGANLNRQIRIFIPGKLSAGRYWVRLYDSPGTQLREFGLDIK